VDEFPPNSHAAKQNLSSPEVPAADSKKLQKVVTGEVIRQKKSFGKRAMESFVNGDSRSVVSYILWDVLIPAAKDTIADAASQGVERLLFGEALSSSRRTGFRPNNNNYTNYSRFSQSQRRGNYRPEETRPPMTVKARRTHDFDEIILSTRPEAEHVIERLYETITKYQEATVADLYELLGLSCDYTDNKWGWYDLRNAGVIRVPRGYKLALPKPEPLDR
jgi:hypothetical protein